MRFGYVYILAVILLLMFNCSCVEADKEVNSGLCKQTEAKAQVDIIANENNSVVFPEDWPLPELTLPDSCTRAEWPLSETLPSVDGFTYSMDMYSLHRRIASFSFDGDIEDLIKHIESCILDEGFIKVFDGSFSDKSTSRIWNRKDAMAETYVFLTNLTSIRSNLFTLGIDVTDSIIPDEK